MIYEITDEAFIALSEKVFKTEECSPEQLACMYTQRPEYYVNNGTAYIAVWGPLVKNASECLKLTGVTDYVQIADELHQALIDPSVLQVVLCFDSGGGVSMGSEEISNLVATFPKPTIGLIEGICASAAYKIASACTFIASTVSSECGSIGSIIIIENSKKMVNAMGITKDIFTNEGAVFKSTAQDFGNTTPEQKTYLQDKINKNGERFQAIVKSNRPELSEQTFNAAMFSAEEALSLGLIDIITQ